MKQRSGRFSRDVLQEENARPKRLMTIPQA